MFLPVELLAQIFSYVKSPGELHSCVLVCTTWNYVAASILWKSPKPASAHAVERFTQTLLSSRKQRARNNWYKLIQKFFPNKKLALLSRFQATRNYGLYVEEIDLSTCQTAQIHVKDSFIQAVTSTCPNISKIDVTNCYKLTDASVIAVSSRCRELKEFSIAGCTSISDSALSTLAQGCPKLRVLCARLCFIEGTSLGPIVQGCPELTSLDLSHCQSISKQSLERVFDTGREFESLQLEYCRVTRSIVHKIALYSGKLRHLNLNNVYILTDSTIVELVRHSSQLACLSVASSSISDSGILSLAQNCKQLKSVDMSYCNGVTSRSVSALATQCPDIEQLSIAFCDNISDAGIISIANSLPNIQSINITSCPKITDVSVKSLLKQCRNLQNLKMSYCVNITREAIQEIPDHFVKLQSLDISGMQDLEDEDVRKIIKKYPDLQLQFKGCSNISDEFLDEMTP